MPSLKREVLSACTTIAYSVFGRRLHPVRDSTTRLSFDLFPTGWDKTYCLKYLAEADFDEIHFFGDKTFEGGNDFEIFSSPRTIGHAIADADPLTTLKKLSELFGVACPASLTPPGAH